MDEESEDRLTELARSRLADTLSEAARLLSSSSSDPAPARRTERLGIDEVLLGLSRHPTLGLVPDPEPSPREAGASPEGAEAAGPPASPSQSSAPEAPSPAGSRNGQEKPGPSGAAPPPESADAPNARDTSGTSGPSGSSGLGVAGAQVRPSGLRTEVDQLRADVETARRRVEAAEARAEEHEAALADLRAALERLRRASSGVPPYERPSFASVVIGEASTAPSAPLPVVAFSLGTVPSSPAVRHASRLGTTPRPAIAPLRAQLVEADRTHSDPPAAGSTAPELPGTSKPSGPSETSKPSGPSETTAPATATEAAASEPAGRVPASSTSAGTDRSAGTDTTPTPPEPDGDAAGAGEGSDGYSWPFVPPSGQREQRGPGGRRRFWHRW